MKAWRSNNCEGPDTLALEEIDAPQPGPGELLVAVAACGLNFPDVLTLRDAYQLKTPRPFTPGVEVAGTVLNVGEGVHAFTRGDRVAGFCDAGGLAELAMLSAKDAFALPDEISLESAASFILTYSTAYYGLIRRGGLRAEDRVLILGAGGGVGRAATELASALGANVTGAASDRAKLDVALKQGAASVISYPRDLTPEAAKELGRSLKDAAGPAGFDIVVDPVGGDYCEPAIRAMAWGGRYLAIGFTAGIPHLPLNLPLLKGGSVVGVDSYQYGKREPESRAQDMSALFELVRQKKIFPEPSELVSFEEAPDALARMENRSAVGKFVVEIKSSQCAGAELE